MDPDRSQLTDAEVQTDRFALNGIPRATLAALGLDGMEAVSDAVGMQVRGAGSEAFASGRSLVFGQLIDPVTGNLIVASDTNGQYSRAMSYGRGWRGSGAMADAGPQGSAISINLGKGPGYLATVPDQVPPSVHSWAAGSAGSAVNLYPVPKVVPPGPRPVAGIAHARARAR